MPPFHCSMGTHSNNSLLNPPCHPCPVHVACMFCDVVVLAAAICSQYGVPLWPPPPAANTTYRTVSRTASILRSTAKFDSIFCSSCHGRPGTSWRTSSLDELLGGHNKTVSRRAIDKAVGRIVACDSMPRISRRGATVPVLCCRLYSVSTID